jgi:hypothetical protein
MLRKLILLLASLHLAMGNTAMENISDELSNETIEYATEIPRGSPFVSLGRQVVILGPAPVASRLKDAAIEQNIPELIGLLASADKDWAANLVLYSISGRDALPLAGIENGAAEWRASRKEADVAYWTKWWSANRDHLAWDGAHLIPAAKIPQSHGGNR